MWFPSCRTQHTQRIATQYAMHARDKCNAPNRFYPFVRCVFRMHALRTLHLLKSASHDQRVLHPLHCVWQLGNRPLCLFSYAYMRFPSCCTQHTQRNGCTACDAIKKDKIRNACTQKTQCVQSILFFSFFCVRALRLFICVAS